MGNMGLTARSRIAVLEGVHGFNFGRFSEVVVIMTSPTASVSSHDSAPPTLGAVCSQSVEYLHYYFAVLVFLCDD